MKFPAYDEHFVQFDPVKYQRPIYEAAMKYVTNRGCAVDAGAHVGIFSARMAADFKEVWAFEPQEDNFACLKQNCPTVNVVNMALWDQMTLGKMVTPKMTNSGAWVFMPCGKTQGVPLDYYELDDVGLIKIDVQGSEAAVIDGAKETIRKWKPVLIVEHGNEEQLKSMGYRLAESMRNDGVYVPMEAVAVAEAA